VPEIGCIIVTWKTPQETSQLARYLDDLWEDSVRIVIVDCGRDHVPTDFPEGVALLAAPNLGYAGGNNLGFRYCAAAGLEYALVLNSDAFPLDGALELLVGELTGDPGVAACGGSLIRWTPSDRAEWLSGYGMDWRTGQTPPEGLQLHPHDTIHIPGAMALFSLAAVDRIGGFDARLFLYSEETDWSERARAAGYRVVIAPQARAMHRMSRSTVQAPKAVSYFIARNRVLLKRRYATIHGHPFSVRTEAQVVLRALVGKAARGEVRKVIPTALGTLRGVLARDLTVDTDPYAAVRQQRWEVRDSR
jgi:GT2 family glycosyltransferase